MGTIKKIFFLIILFNFISCNVFEKGKTDSNGQYVPKKEKYKLKDRADCIFPINLDTVNVYRLLEMYYNGVMTYPINNYPENQSYDQIKAVKSYIKFYSQGRCLIFSVLAKDNNGFDRTLKESDLNPNNENYKKSYYCSQGNDIIQIESFVYGEGFGDYIVLNYQLNEAGDTLKMISEKTVDIYVKKELLVKCIKYKIDW